MLQSHFANDAYNLVRIELQFVSTADGVCVIENIIGFFSYRLPGRGCELSGYALVPSRDFMALSHFGTPSPFIQTGKSVQDPPAA